MTKAIRSALATGVLGGFVAGMFTFTILATAGAGVGATLLLSGAAAFLASMFVSATEIDLARREPANR